MVDSRNGAFLGSLLALVASAEGCTGNGTTNGSAPTDAGEAGVMATVDAGEGGTVATLDTGSPGAPGEFADAAPVAGFVGTASRPLLSDTQAADYTIRAYLARAGNLGATGGLVTDDWDPTSGVGDVATFTPTYTVAAGGTYPTVQSAIDAAVAAGGANRVFILVSAGTYREVVCIPAAAPPITLYGASADPSQTTIVYNNYNGEPTDAGAAMNRCTASATAATYGTSGSATFVALDKGFQAKNITFSNDVSVTTLAGISGTQGVALMTRGDQVVLENVRVLGHQDSLNLESPDTNTVVRAYVKSSFIAGDVDFVFGAATSVLDGCTIHSVSDRKTSGQVLAPDTDARNPYGMLVVNSSFTADQPTLTGIGLGRAWDHGCGSGAGNYLIMCVDPNPNGAYPSGQALVRDSMLGAHIDLAAPWKAAATTNRPFSATPSTCLLADGGVAGTCPANRLYEYKDTP